MNTVTKDDRINIELENKTENPEAFRYQNKRKQRNSPKKLSQQQINSNITRFLDRFEVDDSDNSSKSEQEMEMENTPESEVDENETPENTENTPQPEVT